MDSKFKVVGIRPEGVHHIMHPPDITLHTSKDRLNDDAYLESWIKDLFLQQHAASTTHVRNSTSPQFEATWNGLKHAETSKDGWGYRTGDFLLLRHHTPGTQGAEQRSQQLYCLVQISHVLRNCTEHGLKEGFALLSLALKRVNIFIKDTDNASY